jgi:hypothetical protein
VKHTSIGTLGAALALALGACGGTGSSTFIPGADAGARDGTFTDAPHFAFDSGHTDGGGPGSGLCTPLTCAKLGFNCGPAGDGCGGALDCGVCKAPETCGGGGHFSQCGGSAACVPETCKELGINCGPAGDGCGGALSCGSCTAPDICGGGGVASVCGDTPPCTGLCKVEPTCDGSTTTLSGTVVAGTQAPYLGTSSPDPVPNVLVYVPNGTPAAFTDGPSCGCAPVTGDPLPGVIASTDYMGNFTLTGVPVPTSGVIPLVIQLGKWRRIFGLGNVNNPGFPVTACSPNNAGAIHMPRNQGEGDIPLTAISTGNVDAMECVLLKMGVDQAEFTDPPGYGSSYDGRIQFYVGNGAKTTATTPSETVLVPFGGSSMDGGGAQLDLYDQVILPCWGDDPVGQSTQGANYKDPGQQADMVNYTGIGGRMFATHFSYAWLYEATPFSAAATWTPNNGSDTSGTAVIPTPPTGFADVDTFYEWMDALTSDGATTGDFPLSTMRNDFQVAGANTELWASVTGAGGYGSHGPSAYPVTFTFNTPYSTATPPPAACGKVIYSDFHVTNTTDTGGLTFPGSPSYCTGEMTAQEKSLEYLIWDLSSCPPGPPPPSCTPGTCKSLGFDCGTEANGCGGSLSCGMCTGGMTCGGGGSPGKCGEPMCTPKTCAELGFNCGAAGDGCGGALDCGTCSGGAICGGGGTPGVCGSSGHPK